MTHDQSIGVLMWAVVRAKGPIMKTLKSCVMLLALIPLLPVIALAWLCVWTTPKVQKPVSVAPIPKSLLDTVRIGARRHGVTAP